ncbi:alpha/beta fold hydrolase [Pseudonocardia hydrocarbonoxydans]|uniref:Hydrolase n=1 Tax=Pseudonocardia hydrocarbonoxydans TaxID=76726 RepID=A0A4Y3WIS8_9PSEU|nr:alpha/beta hydrolase [Pseudonocardia hydrocarbonoxydans]GEC18842.1 hydrolase [Pseudonocardia hydrocarbonoxydans]
MERLVDVAPGVRLWAEDLPATGPDPEPEPVLLVMGANASGLVWPDALVDRLAERHRVIRYDHRDTGRSTWAFDEHPYAVTDLAADVVAVLDAFDVPRAHLVGMSMGGTLVQLVLLDAPGRVATATVFCTAALGGYGSPDLPAPPAELLALWEHLADPRDAPAELDWRVAHWRALSGTGTPFDAEEFRALERRVIAHAGRHDNPAAHARAAQTGLDRGAELAAVEVPTLVVEAPEDPINPPPHSGHLARALGRGRLVRIPGMGHAITRTVVAPLAAAILTQTTLTPTAGAVAAQDPQR